MQLTILTIQYSARSREEQNRSVPCSENDSVKSIFWLSMTTDVVVSCSAVYIGHDIPDSVKSRCKQS